ncbi:PP2C family protein-serine/threonine phosphatase [Catenuloplanes atrovinosus]|uniref:Serine/threonine protein phosphatase PrpC n=1 Tax=Catenuloplanes atrovinosus TaxID=137266 RepID=A0AAE4CAE9_9ACTN|nr:PP2C family protein-serine/threonine phosphatase [Catenuloplanes atrovinosus]MDR7275759.1 serine/threonine protein phosphatase PrpC [Catenuloplanes atrovinosus]
MSSLESVRQLLRQAHRARPEDLPGMVMRAAPQLDATALIIYLVDLQQRQLTPLNADGTPGREPLAVDGTLPGRAYCMTTTITTEGDDAGARLWVPLLDGAERLGVLEVVSAAPMSAQAVADCKTVASLLGEIIVTRSLYTDTIERVRRREPMRLPAEILRAQLPPLTFATERLVVSGILEPCYDVAGDAFDYAVNGDVAHLALFDAAGHGSSGGTRAVMLATQALGAYRNARRTGLDLIATYHHIDDAVRAYDRAGMITAVLAELDQRTGMLRVISAGHPSGIVLRAGKAVKILPTPTALPVPLGDLQTPVVVEELLEPGDQLLLYTDGITEARSRDGQEFGVERLIDFAVRAVADQLPAPETTRRLVHAILAHQDETLQDDATVLLAEWRDTPPTQLQP